MSIRAKLNQRPEVEPWEIPRGWHLTSGGRLRKNRSLKQKRRNSMATKPTKKKTGTKGMRLWYVKLHYSFLSSYTSLFIVTRSRNLSLAVKKAQDCIRRFHSGRIIESIEYKGTIDN
jgi:hypothetical protein